MSEAKYRLKKDYLSQNGVRIPSGTVGTRNYSEDGYYRFEDAAGNLVDIHIKIINDNPDWFEKVEEEKIFISPKKIELLNDGYSIEISTKLCFTYKEAQQLKSRLEALMSISLDEWKEAREVFEYCQNGLQATFYDKVETILSTFEGKEEV